MDVDRNYRNYENREQSYSVSSMTNTNTTFSKFLAKHDFNAIAELVRLQSERNDNKSGMRKEFYKSKPKDSSDTHGDAFRAEVGENRQDYSMKRDDSEGRYSNGKGSVSGMKENYNDQIDQNKNDSHAKISITSSKSHNYDFSCSKNEQILNNYLAQCNQVKFQHEEHVQGSSKGKFPVNMSCAEKTTYCRPVYNCYNKEFVDKTIEKNIKLQKLLKKIVLARKREKEKENWNNYLNELKNKHSYYSHEPRHISPQYVPRENMYPGPTNDYYNTQHSWNDPKTFGSLMHSVYGCNEPPAYEYYYPSDYDRTSESPVLSNVYRNEQYCFPTSSQGRFMMMQRDRLNPNQPYQSQAHRFETPTPIIVERKVNYNNTHSHTQPHGLAPTTVFEREMKYKNPQSLKSQNFKTKRTTLEDCGCSPIGELNPFFKEKSEQTIGVKSSVHRVETTKEKYDRVTENVNRLKAKLDNQSSMQRKTSLKVIEIKLDALMTSLNNFMAEMKSKKEIPSPSLTPLNSIESSDNSRVSSLPPRHSSCFGEKRKSVTIVGNATNTSAGVLQAIPFSNSILRHATGTTRISNILDEERDKSDKLRREIEELLPTRTKRPCVQITFDIPTKERATEVTNSLSKTKLSNRDTKVNEVIDEIMSPNRERHRKMTIAVNTDPLGLLALFRVSSEAIKRLMSYMDYTWYFSRLPLPQVAKSGVLDYICNICGDAFARPSELSDHIMRHKLGNAKDCCVCRHALESKRCCSSLFGCQYCGQVFTRAYCCELHQQTCARRFGRQHDVSSSLVVLS